MSRFHIAALIRCPRSATFFTVMTKRGAAAYLKIGRRAQVRRRSQHRSPVLRLRRRR